MYHYIDRVHAGKILAEYLKFHYRKPNTLVLALPRGGVPVAYEIAKSLAVPLDVFIVRKLGVPWHEELAMGALASGGTIIFNEDIIHKFKISKSDIDHVIHSEQQELNRREIKYRGKQPFPMLRAKTIILVDDGIATGASMRAAIKGVRQHHPTEIIIAVPVAAQDVYDEIKKLADQVICPLIPPDFYAVGACYENFPQTEDKEVSALLLKAKR
jgi:predicted phosphoribosyltransferase